MNIALNSVIASTSSTTRVVTRGGLTNNANDAISSNNGLALLAALTIKSALNIQTNTVDADQQVLFKQQINASNCINPHTTSYNTAGAICENIENHTSLGLLATNKKPQVNVCTNEAVSIKKKRANSNRRVSPTTIDPAVITATPPPTPLISNNFASTATTIINSVTSLTTPTQNTKTKLTTPTTNNGNSNNKHFKIPSDLLDDLASRFIINVPDMELNDLIRICFQIELAHWFYLDFFCTSDEDRKLHPCGMKSFAMQLFQHIPFLNKHLSSIDKILEDWKNYKLSVPTYGAILVSEDLNFCLLVQSYFTKSSWGFPKGKVNENEDPEHCATREVYEETGYDITNLIVPKDFIEANINFQHTRLYIVQNVSLETQFAPRTRNEIKCCDWFPIDALPNNKNDAISKAKLGINSNAFFMIMPFIKRLKKWVSEKRALVAETQAKLLTGCQSPEHIVTVSPKSTSPLTTLMHTTTANNAGNNNNIQKHLNTNNSCKKNRQQLQSQLQPINNYNDDEDVTKIVDTGALYGSAIKAPPSNTVLTQTSAKRSKRQRHKSMGDLDGVRLYNINNPNNNIKTNAYTQANCANTTNVVQNNCSNNVGSNQKRNGAAKNVATNSSYQYAQGNGVPTKRQLFHSQSQNANGNIMQQYDNIVSSFDLIRKEKQQQMISVAQLEKVTKAQKQTQPQTQQPLQQQQQQQQQQASGSNANAVGRTRAKSQGDKMCMQNQSNKLKNNNANNNNSSNNYFNNNSNNNFNNNNNTKNRKSGTQKQNSMLANNLNMINNNITNYKNNTSNINNKNAAANTINGHKTPPPISGTDLLAFASLVSNDATVPAQQEVQAENCIQFTAEPNSKTKTPATSEPQTPRPLSVSVPTENATPQLALERMASNIDFRVLKRTNSYQPQQLQRQHIKFTPCLNSWTNFSFTKNFITNVFC